MIFCLALVCILRRVSEQLVNSRAVAWENPPPRRRLKITVYESNLHTIQELKDNIIHAVAAIKITMLHRVYLNMVRRAQLYIDVAGSHFQHLIRWYILSPFGYCINFCIYAMLRTRATFSWPTLYITPGIRRKKSNQNPATFSEIRRCSRVWIWLVTLKVNLLDICFQGQQSLIIINSIRTSCLSNWRFWIVRGRHGSLMLAVLAPKPFWASIPE